MLTFIFNFYLIITDVFYLYNKSLNYCSLNHIIYTFFSNYSLSIELQLYFKKVNLILTENYINFLYNSFFINFFEFFYNIFNNLVFFIFNLYNFFEYNLITLMINLYYTLINNLLSILGSDNQIYIIQNNISNKYLFLQEYFFSFNIGFFKEESLYYSLNLSSFIELWFSFNSFYILIYLFWLVILLTFFNIEFFITTTNFINLKYIFISSKNFYFLKSMGYLNSFNYKFKWLKQFLIQHNS